MRPRTSTSMATPLIEEQLKASRTKRRRRIIQRRPIRRRIFLSKLLPAARKSSAPSVPPATPKPPCAICFGWAWTLPALNFSHGTHEDHAHNIQRLRRAAEREGRTLCILQDLQGPKIRTGPLGAARARPAEDRLARDHHSARRSRHGHPHLDHVPRSGAGTRAGARILLSDGLIELRVREVRGQRCALRRSQRRHAGRAQGHQSSGHRAFDSRAYRKRSQRSRIRPQPRRGRGRAFVRAHRRRRQHGQADYRYARAAMSR